MLLRTPVRAPSLANQTIEILTEQIKHGVYPPKSQMPPKNELAAELNVSRATIRSALSVLATHGLVVRRHGSGTFVSQYSHISNPLNETEDFSYIIAGNGFNPEVQYPKVAIAPPKPDVEEVAYSAEEIP